MTESVQDMELTASLLITAAISQYSNNSVRVDFCGRAVHSFAPAELLQEFKRQQILGGQSLNRKITTALDIVNGLWGGAKHQHFDLATVLAAQGRLAPPQTEQEHLKMCAHSGAPRQVVVYGFGRIGRLLCRLAASNGLVPHLELAAIVVRPSSNKEQTEQRLRQRIELLQRDTVHGDAKMSVALIYRGGQAYLQLGHLKILIIEAAQPQEANYQKYGLSNDLLVIDSTGSVKDAAGLKQHLTTGAAKVLLTAPSSDAPTFVYGINHQDIKDSQTVLSAASCTTTAVVTALNVLLPHYGIERGHLETVHAYTSDQNLVDNTHSSNRRTRSAAANMVISTTGAAKAIEQVLPQLAGKFTGNAVRVPVTDGSLAILILTLDKPADSDHIQQIFKQAALHSAGVLEVDWSGMHASSDTVGKTAACVVDLEATICSDSQLILYLWYDNELGYARQVWRLAEHLQELEIASPS